MRVFLFALALAAFAGLPALAFADDEGSEHTAQLVGGPQDTMGVTLRHSAAGGAARWELDFRPRPGAEVEHPPLPFLRADHAHYAVVVTPGRRYLVFVLISAETLAPETEVVWIWRRDGKLMARFSLGALLDATELASLPRSVSHTQWLSALPSLTRTGITLPVGARPLHLDPVSRRFKRTR